MDPLGKVPCLQVCCCKQTVTSFGSLHTTGVARPSAKETTPEQKPRCASEMATAVSLQSYSCIVRACAQRAQDL